MKNNNYLWTHTGSKLSNPMPTVIFCQWISHVWMVQIPVWMIEIWILTVRRYHERLRVFWSVSHQLWLLQIYNCWSMHPIHMSLQKRTPHKQSHPIDKDGNQMVCHPFYNYLKWSCFGSKLVSLSNWVAAQWREIGIRAKKSLHLYARHVEVFQVWAESFVTFDLGWRLDCYWNATCMQSFLTFLLNHTFDFAWFVICLQQSLDLWQMSFLVSQSREIPAVQV